MEALVQFWMNCVPCFECNKDDRFVSSVGTKMILIYRLRVNKISVKLGPNRLINTKKVYHKINISAIISDDFYIFPQQFESNSISWTSAKPLKRHFTPNTFLIKSTLHQIPRQGFYLPNHFGKITPDLATLNWIAAVKRGKSADKTARISNSAIS